MEIYMFDGETKEYIGAEDALLDPLETKKQGKPVYLLPANAVFDRPPIAEGGKAVIFDDGWKQVVDNRGKEAVNAARGRFTIDYVGEREGDTILTEELITALDSGEKIIRNGAVIDKPIEEKEAEARMQRNSLLAATDKYMVSDFPINEEEREQYRQYRQYLRDIPAEEGFPDISVLTFAEWKESA